MDRERLALFVVRAPLIDVARRFRGPQGCELVALDDDATGVLLAFPAGVAGDVLAEQLAGLLSQVFGSVIHIDWTSLPQTVQRFRGGRRVPGPVHPANGPSPLNEGLRWLSLRVDEAAVRDVLARLR